MCAQSCSDKIICIYCFSEINEGPESLMCLMDVFISLLKILRYLFFIITTVFYYIVIQYLFIQFPDNKYVKKKC